MSFTFPKAVKAYRITVEALSGPPRVLESRVWELEREDTLDAVLWSLGIKYEGQAVHYCITVF